MPPTITKESLGITGSMCCSFCGKSNTEVKHLIAGPGAYICDECVKLSQLIVAGEPVPEFPSWTDKTDDELLAQMVQVARSREQVDAAVGVTVRNLRERGVTWTRIGDALGITRQSAWERYSGED